MVLAIDWEVCTYIYIYIDIYISTCAPSSHKLNNLLQKIRIQNPEITRDNSDF